MLYGILHLSLTGYIITFLILTQITIASVTLYLHRCQSHRAIDFHPIMSHFFRFWLWLTTGQNTKEWTAVHRKHHAKCETKDDPHSPQVLGINKVLWQGAELYRKETAKAETLSLYGQGTPDDWIENHLYTPHAYLGITLMFMIDLVLFGVPGITIWALQMMWIPFFAAGVINGIGHYFGYRNFEVPDAARNILPLGIFVGGEELHNNHHAFGSSAKFSNKWWEFDLGWFYIKILSFFRLAKVKKVAPELEVTPGKTNIDAETLKAIIINRFNVMANYSREVILPVLKSERERAGKTGHEMFQRAKKLMIKESSLINTIESKRLALLLKKQATLCKVYEYRQQLQMIWAKTSASQKELIESLQVWCRNAENSGISALSTFSMKMKAYTLKSQYNS